MAIEPGARKSAPLKTYSRRVNGRLLEPSSRKRDIEEVSAVKSPPQVKKFKRSSIQSYFMPLQYSSSPSATPSLRSSSDSLEPTSSPPSSPPFGVESPSHQYKSSHRPRRRLQTKPNLTPIARMSESDFYGDDDAQSFTEAADSLDDDSRVSLAEEYLGREERRDYERSRAVSMPQFSPTRFLSGSDHPLHRDMFAVGESNTTSDANADFIRFGSRSRASTETLVGSSTSIPRLRICQEVVDFLPLESGGIYANMMAKCSPDTTGTPAPDLHDSLSLAGNDSPPAPESYVETRSYHFHGNSNYPCFAHLGDSNGSPSPSRANNLLTRPIEIPPKPKKKPTKGSYQQALIDLQLERFLECNQCGMHYNQTIKKDRDLHTKFHRDVMKGRQPKKSTPRIDLMDKYIDGVQHRVRVITRSASAEWRLHFEDALNVSYQDMGGLKVDNLHLWSEIANPHDATDPNKVPRYKIYVYLIGLDPVAVLLAERIARGSRYYNGPIKHDQFEKFQQGFAEDDEAIQKHVSKDISYEVFMSVDRIWTHKDHRRRGLATLLVDYAREDFVPGLVLSKKRIAFSLPTGPGSKFAEQYCAGVFPDAPFLVHLEDASDIIKDDVLCHIKPRPHYSESKRR